MCTQTNEQRRSGGGNGCLLIALFVISIALTGCTDDPWRNALAAQHEAIAVNSQAQTSAQINQAQSADSDRRNAQTRLEVLQDQQAIVAGQAVIAQAGAQTAIVVSNNETLVLVAEQIAQAAKPDYGPLYGAMTALVLVAVVWIVVHGRRAPGRTQGVSATQPATPEPSAPTQPTIVYQTDYAFAYRLPDDTIVLHRYSDSKERVFLPADPFYQRLLAGGK